MLATIERQVLELEAVSRPGDLTYSMLHVQCINGNSHCVPGLAHAPQQYISYARQVLFSLKNLTMTCSSRLCACREIL